MALKRDELRGAVRQNVEERNLRSEPTREEKPEEKPAPEQDEAPEEEQLQPVTVKLPKGWKSALQQHFRSRGLDLSSGVRMILSEYLDREHLR